MIKKNKKNDIRFIMTLKINLSMKTYLIISALNILNASLYVQSFLYVQRIYEFIKRLLFHRKNFPQKVY
jgi:hypothetical protein